MAGADRMQVEEVVRKVLVDEHADVLRESVEWLARQLMEVEVSELIGAERGERTEDRATHRNGYRARRWDTRAGEIELPIPKIRSLNAESDCRPKVEFPFHSLASQCRYRVQSRGVHYGPGRRWRPSAVPPRIPVC